ncbi:hypothetical protein L6452_05348 [Arctium lappa]|uniref:Uncharacterized protein n=1 Tax=Arctium lappa TaxID=4217 RepID=A0ACB9EGL5_ARCLA|nr:hypothetical protein L6452_05348 [Arctium lappa]
MVTGSTENGLFHDAFKYFCEMQNCGILPDVFAYSAFIQLCIGLDCFDLGKMVHAQIIITGYASHVRVSTSLLNMYAKMGRVKDSWKVFTTMTEPNEVSWNALISGFTENGLHLQAFDYFLEMIETGFTPNKYTFVSVLKAIGKLRDAGKGKHAHKCLLELDMESDVFVGTALIDMYSKCGALSDARSVFEMNFISCPLNMPWNAMISGYAQCNCSQEVLELYVKMCQHNIKSDIYTYCSVFTAIATMKCLLLGRQVHGMLLKSGCDAMALSVKNAIADAYSKCGSLEDVQKVFDRLEERDVVSWTIMMSAYSRCFEWEEALVIFSQMREDGFTPNQFTFSNALVACTSLCFLEYGQQLHGLLWKAGWDTDRCIESALIDMYAKCGSISEAKMVFEAIPNPDVVTWTAIISGYAQHGDVVNAIQLFKKMQQLGIEANAVTMFNTHASDKKMKNGVQNCSHKAKGSPMFLNTFTDVQICFSLKQAADKSPDFFKAGPRHQFVQAQRRPGKRVSPPPINLYDITNVRRARPSALGSIPHISSLVLHPHVSPTSSIAIRKGQIVADLCLYFRLRKGVGVDDIPSTSLHEFGLQFSALYYIINLIVFFLKLKSSHFRITFHNLDIAKPSKPAKKRWTKSLLDIAFRDVRNSLQDLDSLIAHSMVHTGSS